jgi:hypothetical protein
MTTGSTHAREGIRLRFFGHRAHIAVSARGGERALDRTLSREPSPRSRLLYI